MLMLLLRRHQDKLPTKSQMETAPFVVGHTATLFVLLNDALGYIANRTERHFSRTSMVSQS
jgi:hypothetical protein